MQIEMNKMIYWLAANRTWLYKILGPISEKDEFIKSLIQISQQSHAEGDKF